MLPKPFHYYCKTEMSGPWPTTVLGILGFPIQYTGGVRGWSQKKSANGTVIHMLKWTKRQHEKKVSLYAPLFTWKKEHPQNQFWSATFVIQIHLSLQLHSHQSRGYEYECLLESFDRKAHFLYDRSCFILDMLQATIIIQLLDKCNTGVIRTLSWPFSFEKMFSTSLAM